MLPLATTSLMASLIIQYKKKEMSPLENLLRTQGMICRNNNTMPCSNPEETLFRDALCEVDFSGMAVELISFVNSDGISDVSVADIREVIKTLYDAFGKVTMDPQLITEATSKHASRLTPFERLIFLKKLQGVQRYSNDAQNIAALQQWRSSVETTDVKATWKKLNTFVNEVIRTYELQHDEDKLEEDVRKFFGASQEHHKGADAEDQSTFFRYLNCEETRTNDTSPGNILSFLKKATEISEDIDNGLSDTTAQYIGLYAKTHTTKAIERFINYHGNRPAHSAVRLFLSSLWMIHAKANSIPAWNAVAPAMLDMASSINRHIELLPPQDAYFVDTAKWSTGSRGNTPGSSLQVVTKRQTMLKNLLDKIISRRYNDQAMLKEILNDVAKILDVVNEYLCPDHHTPSMQQSIYAATVTLLRSFPDPEELLCELPQSTLGDAYKWISDRMNIRGYVENVTLIKAGKITSEKCTTASKVLAEVARVVYNYIEAITSPKGQKMLSLCIDRILNGPLYDNMKRNLAFGSHVLKLGKEVLLQNVRSTNTSLLSYLIDKITSQLPVYGTLRQVILEEPLRNSLEDGTSSTNSSSLDWILQFRVNLNTIALHSFSTDSLRSILCALKNDTKAQAYRGIETLCNMNLENATIPREAVDKLKKHIAEAQKNSFYSGSWLYDIISNWQVLKRHFGELLLSSKELSSILSMPHGSSWDIILSAFKLFDGESIHRMAESLGGILHVLDPIFSGGTLVDTIQGIVNGLKGLDILEKAGMFDVKYDLEALLANITQAMKTLNWTETDTVHKNPVTRDITIDLSKVRVKEGSHSGNLNELLCSSEDNSQVFGNITHREIIRKIQDASCRKDNALLVSTPLSELIVGKILRNIGDIAFDGILKSSGLARSGVSSALNNLSAAPKIVPLIREKFSLLGTTLDAKTSNALEKLNVSHDGVRVLATPAALQLVGTLICGKPLKAVQEEFKLLEVSPKEPTLDKQETEELPSEFCRHGYEQIMHMTGGPIIWGFLKPILRGQLLYAPNTANAHTVMHQLNKTFDSMSVIIDALYIWGQGTSGLKFLIEEDGALTKLKNLVASEELQEVAERMLGKDMQQFLGQLDVDDIRHELGGLKGLLDFVELVGNISQCFELNRFRGYDTEDALEAAAIRLSHRRQFISAVVFTNLEDAKPSGSPLPPHVQYKIRMDIDNVPFTHAIRDRFWRPGPRDDFLDDMRYLRGFAHFQQLIDQAILAVQTSDKIPHFPPTYVQQFPYPCYQKDSVGYYIKAMLPLVFTLAWILLVAFFIRERVLPRELHLEEIMHVMGLRPWVDWTAWFIIAAFISFAIIFCNTVILTTGGILPHSDPLLTFIFFGAFALSVLMYCNMISTLFRTATIASLTGTVGFLVSFLPFVIAVSMEANLKLGEKLFICLFMSSAFSYGCLYVTRFEEQGLGIHRDLLWSSPIPNDDMNLGYCIAAMLVDSLIYFALAWYIQGQRGGNSSRPWYFVFWPSCWNRPKRACDGDSISTANHQKGDFLKGEGIGARDLGISIRNLHVAYELGKSNERVAVSGLTLDFNEGQISTLLGQNGAGKTTTLKVLTGQYRPSSGHVYVYGRNVMDRYNHIREFLGYCPQYNTLFGKLTVREHLIFFAKLKGQLSTDEARDDVEIMLNQMGLRHVEDLQACRLSGGLQRRLCVGLSFIGGSKLVILDEPTSSVDPVARRNIWDLILKCKEGRTILLTTHHMDEADILSDKVAIIHRGHLLCSGPPLTLKARFGCGYQLSLARSSNEPIGDNDSGHASAHSAEDDLTNINGLLKLIRSIIPSALLIEEHGSEVIISLPQRDPEGNMYTFSELIALLDDNMLEYGFSNYGLSSTTLEEVFLSLCTMCDAGRDFSSVQTAHQFSKVILLKALGKANVEPGPALDDDDVAWTAKESFPLTTLDGSSLKMQQLQALLQKRLYHAVSDWKAIFFSIVMPCLFIALAMGFTLIVPATMPEPPLKLTAELYSPGTVAFMSASSLHERSPSLLSEATNIITESQNEANFWLIENVDFHGSNWKQKSHHEGQCNYAYSSSVVPRNTTGSFETPSSNVLYNISEISVVDYLINTYPAFTERRYGGWSFNKTYAKVWFENTGYHSLPVYQTALSNAFLKSAIRRSNPSIPYSSVGITVYNHPLHLTSEQLGKQTIINHIAEVGIAIVILMGLASIPSRVTVYVVNERARDEKQVQRVSGVGPALYWTAAYIWDMGLVLCTVLLSGIILIVFGLPVYTSRLNLPAVLLLLLGFGWGTTPLMYILSRLFKEASISFMVLYCVNLFIGLNIAIIMLVLGLMKLDTESRHILGITQKVALVFPQYSLIAGLVDLAKNEIQSEVYAMFGQDTYESPFSKHLLAYNYLAMFLAGIGFFCLNLFIEYVNKGYGFRRRDEPRATDEDNDVYAERIRVSSDAGKSDVLKIMDLVKVYHGRHPALNHVSFGIPKGECFGLLGVNGAGKTTLFRILTGQLHPTHGSASVQDTSLKKVYKKNIQLLGYCPQADALDDLLTARQHLIIYAKLRGIQKNEIQPVVDSMLAKFHLTMHARHRVKTLSRGNKRKLCAAISMIGNPQIVLLDEPTSGMDPVTRRLVWSNVSKAIRNKQSVLLTSHSMAECDILCSRLAIMVNGRLCCIGSPQYLKHRYGAGYTVTIRLSETALDWEKAVTWIQATFPRIVIKAHHCNVIEFNVPSREVSLYSIFKFLETEGVKMGVTDFLVSQTTLDQVFVNFVRLQTEDELLCQAEESLCPLADKEKPCWERPQDIHVTSFLENAKEAESGDCDSVQTKL
ncbi:phospholipid-transporting ATPase ABCA1-like isoform X2 [Ornithodoros turicata]|uniref:phospholipid-transporting ATPase ABCA1-like isoform X2 n=1 Tax=Ornithodoros turicata TaxID=34597 RepID=UPI003139F9BA